MNQIRKGTNSLEGKILIESLKELFEKNIQIIFDNLVEDDHLVVGNDISLYMLNDEDEPNEGYTEINITILDNDKLCIISDNDINQQQVIMDTSIHNSKNIPDTQTLYKFITKSNINVFKCIYKNKDIDGHIYNYVLAAEPYVERDIKMRCLSFILDSNIEKLLANEIAMEGEYDLRKFMHTEPNKVSIILYDPVKNRMSIDIQLYDERETFIFTFEQENVDISVNTLTTIVLNATISDYLSEDFGLVYTLDDRLS